MFSSCVIPKGDIEELSSHDKEATSQHLEIVSHAVRNKKGSRIKRTCSSNHCAWHAETEASHWQAVHYHLWWTFQDSGRNGYPNHPTKRRDCETGIVFGRLTRGLLWASPHGSGTPGYQLQRGVHLEDSRGNTKNKGSTGGENHFIVQRSFLYKSIWVQIVPAVVCERWWCWEWHPSLLLHYYHERGVRCLCWAGHFNKWWPWCCWTRTRERTSSRLSVQSLPHPASGSPRRKWTLQRAVPSLHLFQCFDIPAMSEMTPSTSKWSLTKPDLISHKHSSLCNSLLLVKGSDLVHGGKLVMLIHLEIRSHMYIKSMSKVVKNHYKCVYRSVSMSNTSMVVLFTWYSFPLRFIYVQLWNFL